MKLKYSLILLAAAALTGCEERIDDRFKEEPSSGEAVRTVLIEEYTGVDCSNCPAGHERLRTIETRYNTAQNLENGVGVISVGIHIPAFGDLVQDGGLVAGEAETLSQNQSSAPAARINRSTEVLTPDKWLATVDREISRTTVVKFSPVVAEVSGNSIVVNGSAIARVGIDNALIHAWVVEDDIVTWQKQENGDYEEHYSHHGVYRAHMSALGGNTFPMVRNMDTPFSFTYPLNDVWNPDNLRVVVFIEIPGKGIENATQANVQINN